MEKSIACTTNELCAVKMYYLPNLQYRGKASIRFQNFYFHCSGTRDVKLALNYVLDCLNFDESA